MAAGYAFPHFRADEHAIEKCRRDKAASLKREADIAKALQRDVVFFPTAPSDADRWADREARKADQGEVGAPHSSSFTPTGYSTILLRPLFVHS